MIQPVDLDRAAVWSVKHGIHQAHLFRAPIWCPSGGGGTCVARGTVVESLVRPCSTHKRVAARTVGYVSPIFSEGGGQLDHGRAREVLDPSARESKAPFRSFLGES